jgi:hypothetical protein
LTCLDLGQGLDSQSGSGSSVEFGSNSDLEH